MEDTEGRREGTEKERRRDWDVPSGTPNRGSLFLIPPVLFSIISVR